MALHSPPAARLAHDGLHYKQRGGQHHHHHGCRGARGGRTPAQAPSDLGHAAGVAGRAKLVRSDGARLVRSDGASSAGDSRQRRRVPSRSRGLPAVTALSAAAVLVAGPAAAVPAAAMVAPGPGPAAARAGDGGMPRVHVRGADRECPHRRAVVGQDLNAPRPIGSIVKVMTALVVLRTGDLNRPITRPEASHQVCPPGRREQRLSRNGGDVLTARQLLEGDAAAVRLRCGLPAGHRLRPGRAAFFARRTRWRRRWGLTRRGLPASTACRTRTSGPPTPPQRTCSGSARRPCATRSGGIVASAAIHYLAARSSIIATRGTTTN